MSDVIPEPIIDWLWECMRYSNTQAPAMKPSGFMKSVVSASAHVVALVHEILEEDVDITLCDLQERVWHDVQEATILPNSSQTSDKHETTLRSLKRKLAELSIEQIHDILEWDVDQRSHDYDVGTSSSAAAADDPHAERKNVFGGNKDTAILWHDTKDLTMSICIAVQDGDVSLPAVENSNLLGMSEGMAQDLSSTAGKAISEYITDRTRAWDIRNRFLLNSLRPLDRLTGFGNVTPHIDSPSQGEEEAYENEAFDVLVQTMKSGSIVDICTEDVYPDPVLVSVRPCEIRRMAGMLIEKTGSAKQLGYTTKLTPANDGHLQLMAMPSDSQLVTLVPSIAKRISVEKICISDKNEEDCVILDLRETDAIRNIAETANLAGHRELRYFMSEYPNKDDTQDCQDTREASHKFIEARHGIVGVCVKKSCRVQTFASMAGGAITNASSYAEKTEPDDSDYASDSIMEYNCQQRGGLARNAKATKQKRRTRNMDTPDEDSMDDFWSAILEDKRFSLEQEYELASLLSGEVM